MSIVTRVVCSAWTINRGFWKMSRRGIKKFCSAQKCCKPSGRIFWVGWSKCRKWFHIKCVGITKKQSEEDDFFCRPCQVVDTGAPLPLTVDTLIAVTKANPTILKRVPKHARIPLAKLLNEALYGIVAKPHDESCWVSFFLQFCAIMKQPKRPGKRQKSDLGSIICERINKGAALGDLVVPREVKDSKLEQECEKRIKLIYAKLDEGNVRAGIRLAASDDSVAPYDNNTYEKLQSKHPPRSPNHAQQNVEDSLITFEPIVAKAINSFPSGSSGGPSLLVPQLYEDLIAKSNGSVGNEFLQKLTSVLNIVLEGKVPVGLRPFSLVLNLSVFGKKTAEFDQLLLEIPCVEYARNVWALSRLTNDELISMVRSSAAEQVVELKSQHMFFETSLRTSRILKTLFWIMDFKNAFNSLKRDKILDTVFRKRRQIYNYTHSAYSESSHLFFGEKVIQSQEGCQQGDPEVPALFSDTIQDLVNQMVSQYNVWYLDDGNLSDDYRTVLEDLKRIIASADEYGLSLGKTKCYLIFFGNCTESSKKRIKALFDEICPGIKVEDRENLEILGSPMGASARQDLLNKKMIELQKLSEVVTKLDAHYGFYLLKNCFSLPKLLYFLRTSPCFEEVDLLQQYDSIIRKSLSKICNVNIDESSYTQAVLPVSKGGIGIASASQIALPAFLSSASGAKRALSCILPEDYVDAFLMLWIYGWRGRTWQKHRRTPFKNIGPLLWAMLLLINLQTLMRKMSKGWMLIKTPLVQLGWMLDQAKTSVWSWQISNCASPYPSARVRKFARNTLAAAVNLSKRTDIMVFPVPEARDVSRGTTTSKLSWNRRWVPSKFPQFWNHMVWPEQMESAQMELP